MTRIRPRPNDLIPPTPPARRAGAPIRSATFRKATVVTFKRAGRTDRMAMGGPVEKRALEAKPEA